MVAKTYNGKKVLSTRDIDVLSGFKKSTMSKRLNYERKKKKSKLSDGTDYAFAPSEFFEKYKDNNDNYNYPKGCYVITAEGYLKIFGDNANDKILEYYGVKQEKKPVVTNKKSFVSETPKITEINIDKEVQLFQEMMGNFNKIMELQMQFIQQEREANAELRGILKDMVTAIGNTDKDRKTIEDVKAILDELNDDSYMAYRKNIVNAANKIVQKNSKFKSTDAVLSEAYNLLRKEYGVVWEQEKKEYVNMMGVPPQSTLRLQYWIETTKPTYKNLLISKLDSLYSKRD